MSSLRLRLTVAVAALVALAGAGNALAAGHVVISQVYGGGGNSGAPYTHDYVELFNGGAAPASLAGMSIQYASATGTGNLGANSGQLTELAGTIAPGGYFLVQQGAGAGNGVPLPAADLVDGTPIAMAAGAGKVALATGTTSLGCNGGSAPCSPEALARIVDLVGYGTANFFEGAAAAPGLSNTTAALRADGGCTDTNHNAADFTANAPAPRNSASPANTCGGPVVDAAPSVVSTSPANGAAGVARDANITVTFSEPVDVADGWFEIVCTSGPRAAAVSPGPTTFTLDPTANFGSDESCTVTIRAAYVSDVDTDDPPDTMAADHVFSFRTVDVSVCGDPATKIHAVQGSGATTPMNGETVSIEGVVVGDYQQSGGFNGYYVQEELADQDADPATSEGIFVFAGSTGRDVSVGDVVRVRGRAGEFTTTSSGLTSSLTQISGLTSVEVCSTGAPLPPETHVSLPVLSLDLHERYEGMRVRFTQDLTVTEVFTLARFGEVSLSAGGRLYIPTAVATPGADALAVADHNRRSRILLDDGDGRQNIDPTLYPFGGLSALNTLRVGYTLPSGVAGVMDHRFGVYRLQPVEPVHFTASNPRTAAPEPVGGNASVASFNVLNFFNGDGEGGGFPTARGANSQFELDRQEAKLVSALTALDADVVGLMEIENDAGATSALAQLVAALNDATAPGTYAAIDTGVIGTDEIKVALIYKPAAVVPVGDWKILTSADDPRFDTTRNRPALAQTFRHVGSAERFTVVVNHLKSKGSGCGLGDDATDGSGNCDGTRTLAAQALADWLETDPTGSGDPDFMIIGDLNAYTFERPITALEDAGYVNLIRAFNGLTAYSYVFDGESGYLDHALASDALAGAVTGVTEWHINPDEPIALDYNVEFKSAGQVESFYAPDAYRASDHDPVLVGLQLNATFAGVCRLVREVVTDQEVADALCDKLAAAAAAAVRGNTNAKAGQLRAFVNQVEAQTGKSVSAADAAELIRLAGSL